MPDRALPRLQILLAIAAFVFFVWAEVIGDHQWATRFLAWSGLLTAMAAMTEYRV